MDSEVLSYNIIGNKRNLLCGIMDSYLNPPSKTVVMYPPVGIGATNKGCLKGTIRFFEWSDLYRTPILFYTFESFLRFLHNSSITISDFDRNLILSTYNPYITCERNRARLIIRNNSADLKLALDKESSNGSSVATTNVSHNVIHGINGNIVLPSIRSLVSGNADNIGEWWDNR